MAVNKDGKFTKKTEDVVKRIEEAYAMDCSIKEVLIYANISKQTLYNWMEEDKEWKERLDELRSTPFLKARKTVIRGIEENYGNAMDYMKRKKKAEFGDNVDLTSGGEKITPIYGGKSK
jgi:hypothetical protein